MRILPVYYDMHSLTWQFELISLVTMSPSLIHHLSLLIVFLPISEAILIIAVASSRCLYHDTLCHRNHPPPPHVSISMLSSPLPHHHTCI